MASLGQPGDLGVEVEEGAVGEALAADVVGAGARLDLQAPGQHLERVRDLRRAWTSDPIHAGTVRTGERSEICRTISNDVDPLPRMMAALSVSVGTPDAARICSTSWRERRWAELVDRHRRHDPRQVDQASDVVLDGGVGDVVRCLAVLGDEVAAPHAVDE